MLKAFENSHRNSLAGPKKANGVIFIVFEVTASFISRMHIIGIIKQISVMLERKLPKCCLSAVKERSIEKPYHHCKWRPILFVR